MTAAVVVLAILLAAALGAAAALADVVHRLNDELAYARDALAPITLDDAVAVVIDTLATGDDDAVDRVSIDREDESGEYRVFAYVRHADGSTTARGRYVFVPDDLDAPIGVRPVPAVVDLAPGVDVTDAVKGGA